MKRLVLALTAVAVLYAAGAAPAQPAEDKVEITWYGQSFFQIKGAKGTAIFIDPHDIANYPRWNEAKLKGDLLLLTHNHTDHTQAHVIYNFKTGKEKDKEKEKEKELRVIPGWVVKGKKTDWNLINEKVKDVQIRTVGVYHDDMEGFKRGKVAVFIIEIDGWRIVHLGDLGHVLTDEQRDDILKDGPIDVLMIPVGGIYSINGSEAKRVMAQLKPREYVFPMHYGTAVFGDLLTADEFLDEQPKGSVVKLKTNRTPLERDAKRTHPQITVLHWLPKA